MIVVVFLGIGVAFLVCCPNTYVARRRRVVSDRAFIRISKRCSSIADRANSLTLLPPRKCNGSIITTRGPEMPLYRVNAGQCLVL